MNDAPPSSVDEPPPTTAPASPSSAGRRRWTIPVVIVGVAIAGLAAGAGVTPRDVIDAVTGLFDAEPTIDEEAADLMAVDEAGSTRVEAWFGPADDATGECEFVRTLSANIGIVDGEARCVDGPLLPWTDPDFEVRTNSQYFGFVHETPIGTADAEFEAVALSGATHPAITAITARFGDGTEYSFVPDPRDGWFAVILPAEVADLSREDGSLVNVLVELRLFDGEGRVLYTVDVPAWRLATGIR